MSKYSYCSSKYQEGEWKLVVLTVLSVIGLLILKKVNYALAVGVAMALVIQVRHYLTYKYHNIYFLVKEDRVEVIVRNKISEFFYHDVQEIKERQNFIDVIFKDEERYEMDKLPIIKKLTNFEEFKKEFMEKLNEYKVPFLPYEPEE